jgi:hypothetical protein
MWDTRVSRVALICAFPLFSQTPRASDPVLAGGELKWFQLTENKEDVRRLLGPPKAVVGFGEDFESWQYQIDFGDEGEFSHLAVFRRSSGDLISVTRNYETERLVDGLFPEAGTRVMSYPDATHPQYTLRLRRLSGGRVLMAMGVAAAGQPTGQIVLMRESALRIFYPWVSEQLRN